MVKEAVAGKGEDYPVLMLKHKVTKLSQDRIGIYFNQNLVRSLGLESGMEVLVGVKDKKTIVIRIK